MDVINSKDFKTIGEGRRTKLLETQKQLETGRPNKKLFEQYDRQQELQSLIEEFDDALKYQDSLPPKIVDKSLLEEFKYTDYLQEILPPKDNLQEIQEMLETIASSYLVQNNLNNQITARGDKKLDLEFYRENNEMMGKILDSESKKMFSNLSSLLAPSGAGNVISILKMMEDKGSKLLGKNVKLLGKNAEETKEKRDMLLRGRTKPYLGKKIKF